MELLGLNPISSRGFSDDTRMTMSMYEIDTPVEADFTNGVDEKNEERSTSKVSLGEPANVMHRTGQFIQI